MSAEKIAQLEELSALEPEDESLWFLLGQEYLANDRFEQAAGAFARALELKPEYTAAWRRLGDARRLGNRPDEAVAAYRRGIEVARKTRDLQTAKECAVFLKKLGAQAPDLKDF